MNSEKSCSISAKERLATLSKQAGHDEDHHDTTPSPYMYGATPAPRSGGAGREN